MNNNAKGTRHFQNFKNNVLSHGYLNHQHPDTYNNYYNMDGKMEDRLDLSTSDFNCSSSKYLDCPPTKPFINTDYTRAETEVDTRLVSDRNAVVTALKNLQDKIEKLQIERMAAEKNLHSLTMETEQYKQVLESGKPAGGSWANRGKQTDRDGDLHIGQTRERDGQLSSAEHRCHLMENQLRQMTKLVENSERNQRELMEQMGKTRQERDMAGDADIRQHIDRLNELERDQTRLTNTQTLAESKIRELEKRIKEENLHRRTLEEKTVQLESGTQRKTILPIQQTPPVSATPPTAARTSPAQVMRTKKPSKKKKKADPIKGTTCRPEPMKHYRLNLAEIPFVAGKSTGPSHALGANVQKVLAMMKQHNPVLCSQMHANGNSQRSEVASSTSSSSTSMDQDLSDLLIQLQDEFGQLSSRHHEIVDQMHAARDLRLKELLEQELDMLVENMETKSQQISKIRQHQRKNDDAKHIRAPPARKMDKSKRPQTAPSKHHHRHPHYYNSNIVNRNRPKSHASNNKPVGNSALGRPELFMLRDMKKLQTTLRKDDVCWE